MSDQRWHLIHSKPRQEKTAQLHLQRQEYTVYLPMITERKRRRQAWVEVTEPLFPRYLFVRLQAGVDNYAPIRSTCGVSQLVRFGLNPAVVPDAFVNQLYSEDEKRQQIVINQHLEPGDRVRVLSGPFAAYQAIFTESCGQARACILLQLAERETRVRVPLSELEKAG